MNRSAEAIQAWLVERIASLTHLPPEEINVRAPFDDYGLDSVMIVTLVVDLQRWLGWQFHDNPLEDHPTIASLAEYLAAKTQTRGVAND